MLFNPPSFQGNLQKKNYFEGWYLKHVTQVTEKDSSATTLALIPGISLSKSSHLFVQLNLATKEGISFSHYFTLPMEDFHFDTEKFQVQIGKNKFSLEGVEVDLEDENIHVQGKIEYSQITNYPVSIFHPGIMGPFRYVPFMECYHGLVSANHELKGNMSLHFKKKSESLPGLHTTISNTIASRNQLNFDFQGGKGYIEKDWGKSFPSSWIWTQANSFFSKGKPAELSFMISIAKIPWLGSSFVGFLGFVYWEGKHYPFATYNFSKILKCKVFSEHLEILVSSGKFLFEFVIYRDDGSELTAPRNGNMDRVIKESVQSHVELKIFAKKNPSAVLVEAKSVGAGLEVSGSLEELGLKQL